MKLITRDADYAIRALACIAGAPGGMVSVSDLSKDLGIPRPFLRKILQVLNKKGILRSYKGKGGGFKLEKDPSKMTILEIVEVFQGPINLVDHILGGKACPQVKVCYLKERTDRVENYVKEQLQDMTIAMLMKKGQEPWPKEK